MIKNLYRKLKAEKMAPNQLYLNSVLEASIRTDDADIVFDSLTDFVTIQREPHKRLVAQINNMKHLPDRIYVLMKEHFPWSGEMLRRTRQFEKPTFREKSTRQPHA